MDLFKIRYCWPQSWVNLVITLVIYLLKWSLKPIVIPNYYRSFSGFHFNVPFIILFIYHIIISWLILSILILSLNDSPFSLYLQKITKCHLWIHTPNFCLEVECVCPIIEIRSRWIAGKFLLKHISNL